PLRVPPGRGGGHRRAGPGMGRGVPGAHVRHRAGAVGHVPLRRTVRRALGRVCDHAAMTVLVVMGVSGSGKSTVAARLAERLGWDVQEGDDLHPPANVVKMHSGHPLTDEDRWPWLDAVAAWIRAHVDAG